MATDIGPKVGVDGLASYKKQMTSINQSAKELASEMKAVTAAFADNEKSQTALQSKMGVLTKQIDTQRQAVATLQTHYAEGEKKLASLAEDVEKATQQYGENSKEVQKAANAYVAQKTALSNTQTQINKATAAISEMEAKQRELTNETTKAVTEQGKLTNKIDEQQSALDWLKTAYVNASLSYGETSKTAQDLGERISKLSSELKDNKDQLQKAENGADSFDKTLDDLGDESDQTSDKLDDLGDASSRLRDNLLANLAGNAISKAVSAVWDTVTNSIQSAMDRIDTMNQFQRVLTSLTGSSEQATETLNTLTDAVADTAYGLDAAASSTQKLYTSGMELGDATETIQTMMDAIAFYGDGSSSSLENVSDALSKMEAQGKVSADQWQRLTDEGIPVLKLLSEQTGMSMAEVTEALSNGDISADEFISSLTTALNDGTESFSSISGAAKEAGGSFAASFDNMQARVTVGVQNCINAINDWAADNGLPSIQESVANLGTAFKDALNWIAERIPGILDTLSALAPVIEGVAAAVGVLATAMAALKAATAITKAISGLSTVLAAIGGPATLVVAAIAGIGTALYSLWTTNDSFREGVINTWNTLVSWVQDTAGKFIDGVKGFLGGVGDFFGGVFDSITQSTQQSVQTQEQEWAANQEAISAASNAIGTTVANAYDGITKSTQQSVQAQQQEWAANNAAISSAANAIGSKVKQVFGDMGNFVSTKASSIRESATTAFQNLKDRAGQIWDNLKTATSTAFDNVKSAVKSGLDDAVQYIKDLPAQAIQWGKDFIGGLADGIMQKARDLLDSVKRIASDIASYLHFSRPDVGPLRDYETWMPDMIDGMARGIRQNAYRLENAAAALAGSVSVNVDGAAGGGVQNTSNDTYNINVYGAPGQSEDALAQAIAYRLQSMADNKKAVWGTA